MKKNEFWFAVSGIAVGWSRIPTDETAARFIHGTLARRAWSERSLAGRLGLAAGFLVWVPVMLGFLAASIQRMGPGVKRRTRKGFLRQIADQVGLFATKFVPAPCYYVFELYESENRARALDYLYPFETKRGIDLMLRTYLTSPGTVDALSNKAEFAAHCARCGLAAIPVVGFASEGRYHSVDPKEPALPPMDLFVKTLRGGGGKRAERWSYEAAAWRDRSGAALTSDELIDVLRRRSKTRPWIVRPWVSNHRAVEDLACGALSTVRVLTCLDEAGRPEVMYATFRMARASDAIVDNAHCGASQPRCISRPASSARRRTSAFRARAAGGALIRRPAHRSSDASSRTGIAWRSCPSTPTWPSPIR